MTRPAGQGRDGYAAFGPYRTWYRVLGDLDAGGPAPLVTLHGGPGGTHDYLLSMADLAGEGRPVVFYDQVGNGRSTHGRDAPIETWTFSLFLDELDNLLGHLGIAGSYHLLGQSWGGFLGLEHAIARPSGLRSLVVSNSAASYPAWAEETDRLRHELPPEVEAELRRHEAEGTTDSDAYRAACGEFNRRFMCRLDAWPDELVRSMRAVDDDPTVYRAMNGPSEFHITGTARHWSAVERLGEIAVPVLVVSGRFDEATPKLQRPFVERIAEVEQVIFENSAHQPFWEERRRYMDVVGGFLAAHDPPGPPA